MTGTAARPRRAAASVLVALLGALALGACGDEQAAPERAQEPQARAGTARTIASTPAASAAVPAGPEVPEPFPWEPIEDVRGSLARALAQGDWTAVTARATAGVSVMRYLSGSDLQELVADQLVTWLRARWTPNVVVQEAHFVAHFASLELQTTGWRPVPPSGKTIYFVHHVNPDTRRWFLDVVQYE